MEVENALDCVKIIGMLARFCHSDSGEAIKAAANLSKRRETGCAIV